MKIPDSTWVLGYLLEPKTDFPRAVAYASDNTNISFPSINNITLTILFT